MRKLTIQLAIVCCLLLPAFVLPAAAWAQGPTQPEATPEPGSPDQEQSAPPTKVDVQPTAQDSQIEARLARILDATEWFTNPAVNVQEGVVFIDGQTTTQERREWAGNLARNTQDVVAVVNRIEVTPRPVWDFSPAFAEVRTLWRGAIQAIPVIIFGIVVLAIAWWLMKPVEQLARRLLTNRLGSPLLTSIASKALAIPVFLLGLYLVLQVAGLTRLALTLLGGTGIVGIVIGFAFRDIAENFLASILLSIRRPFHSDDLIQVTEHVGIVQQMNTRSTILMTLDGNHIQIPNSTVFKSTIINYTANPNRRSDFVVGIGYDDGILQAQSLIDQVLRDHPAVLKTPESLVLVDELGASTVNLRVYFWYDATLYAPIKIKSSLIRLTKRALADAGISMPDEAREVIFPQGVPLIQLPQQREPEATNSEPEHLLKQLLVESPPQEPVTTAAEGDLRSEDHEIRAQAQRSRSPEEGENLLNEK